MLVAGAARALGEDDDRDDRVRIFSLAARRLCIGLPWLLRSMMMWSEWRSAHPNTGTFVSSFLATQRSWNAGNAATTARTSKWLWWFDMNT